MQKIIPIPFEAVVLNDYLIFNERNGYKAQHLYNSVCFNLNRQDQKVRAEHRIKGRRDALGNINVRNAKGNGCLATHGLTWARNVWSVTWMSIRTSKGHWRNLMGSTCQTNRKFILNSCAKNASNWAITAGECNSHHCLCVFKTDPVLIDFFFVLFKV